MSGQGYSNQFVRVEIESTRYENGQLLVTGRGMAGERFIDLVWYEPHGFHSRPHPGSIGYLMAPGGRREQGFVVGASDPGKRPQIEAGQSAMYDNGGNVVVLKPEGWEFSTSITVKGDITLTGSLSADGGLTAKGDVHSDGNINAAGNIHGATVSEG
jgi:phage gp45-like